MRELVSSSSKAVQTNASHDRKYWWLFSLESFVIVNKLPEVLVFGLSVREDALKWLAFHFYFCFGCFTWTKLYSTLSKVKEPKVLEVYVGFFWLGSILQIHTQEKNKNHRHVKISYPMWREMAPCTILWANVGIYSLQKIRQVHHKLEKCLAKSVKILCNGHRTRSCTTV